MMVIHLLVLCVSFCNALSGAGQVAPKPQMGDDRYFNNNECYSRSRPSRSSPDPETGFRSELLEYTSDRLDFSCDGWRR